MHGNAKREQILMLLSGAKLPEKYTELYQIKKVNIASLQAFQGRAVNTRAFDSVIVLAQPKTLFREFVSETVRRQYVSRMTRIIFQLLSEPCDVNIHRAR